MSSTEKTLPDDGLGTLTTLTVAVLFSGVAFTLIAATAVRTRGARHSVRLQFEQQKIEMQQEAEAENKNAENCHD